jgi:hypothetical protein
VTTLGVFYDQIYNAYYRYAFWDAVPLFEFFCLARILPYMTTEIEKQCIMAGLQKISEDLDLPCSRRASPTLPRSESSLSLEAEDIFENQLTTVIVPALGTDMAESYTEGQVKLLAINVRSFSPFSQASTNSF